MAGALLDRDAELTALARQLAAVREGAGRLLVVEGPAGIGKSSLLAAAIAAAESGGVTVLRARSGPLEQDAPWGVARQLFGPVRAAADWDEVAVGAAGLARRALDLDAAEPALAGEAMHAAAHGLTWLAASLAERGPALLVVDDVQWADAPSLRWLAQLSIRLDELALGLLCAVRAGEPAGEPELLAELLAAAPERRVRPRPLGAAAVEALVRGRLPGATASFTHTCHTVTGGNPFLVVTLLGHLSAEGVPPTDEAAAGLASFGPEQVEQSVARQLARLPDGAATLARAVAILGHGAALRHAAELAGLEQPQAVRLADSLRAAGLLADGAELGFVHPLVAGTVYASLPSGERALWHAAAARLLASERADPEDVALHLLRTEPAADAATVSTLRAAASRTGMRGAPESAAVFLRRALVEPPLDAGIDAELRGELGLALAAHAEPEAPGLLADAVDGSASAAHRVELALRGARALGLAGDFEHSIDLCRRALAEPAGASPETVARVEAELAAHAWLHAETVAEARERLHSPVLAPSPLELWRINAAWEATADARPAREATALLEPALDARSLEDERDSLLGSLATAVLIANDELDTARAGCDALIDAARISGWLIALALGSHMRAMALVRAGRIHEAEADARLAFDYKLAVAPTAVVLFALTALVDSLTELDELDAADAALGAAGQLGDPPAGTLGAPLLLQSRAHLRLAQHRPAEAHADLVAAGARWGELGVLHPGLADWRVDGAEALVALGDREAARRLAREHVDLAERVGLPRPKAAGLRSLARASGPEESIPLLERAVELLEPTPGRLEHTRALVELGAALHRANRRAAARVTLRRALDLAQRGGMRLLAARALNELHAAGARPRRAALSGPASLTPAEHRVAALAAAGCTNREIAERLYITRRTVETHLKHAFQKLEIKARGELPARLAAPLIFSPDDPENSVARRSTVQQSPR
jgi:DNA-binding CsgD family transcriptional regulator